MLNRTLLVADSETWAVEALSCAARSLGLELRGTLPQQLALAVQAEQSTFALDTAHRRGSEIVFDRERFYSWSFWLQVSWTLGLG